MKNTIRALVQRGVDTDTAERLTAEGYTLAKLVTLSADELANLGLPSDAITAIRDSNRPPIPKETLFRLLHDSRNMCCVCRIRNRGVLLHHIDEWRESRSHDEDNLAVICLDCHDKAHTHRELSRELTSEQIRFHKAEWTSFVRTQDVANIFKTASFNLGHAMWDYFNHARLPDLAASKGLDLSQLANFETNANASPNTTGVNRYSGRATFFDSEYRSFASLIVAFSEHVACLDINLVWSRNQIRAMVNEATVFSLSAYFRFSPVGRVPDQGPGQIRRGYYRSRGIGVEFVIDAWETTTSSAWDHLRGGWICTGIFVARSVSVTREMLSIQATCLALGTGFGEHYAATPDVAFRGEYEFDGEVNGDTDGGGPILDEGTE